MTHSNTPANPVLLNGDQYGGLTKREHFAAVIKVDVKGFTVGQTKALMSTELPINDHLENIKWWALLEAKVKVIHADALIQALNQSK